jgi:DNA-binding LacI/PurR family transcriptional regulator
MSSLTQQLLAKKLKLSGTTVSRSLANHPSIAKETRALVLKTAAEMGFSISQKHVVHRKRSAKSITIGVLIGVRNKAPGTATFPFLLKGIHERAAVENVLVEVQYQNPDEFHPEARGNKVFRRIREGRWRGVILVYPFASEAIGVLSRKISAVAALEDYVDLGVDSIDTDYAIGVVRLVRELAVLGHKRIGFVAWEYGINGQWEARRFGAFVEGLYAQGLEFLPDCAFNVHALAPRLSPGAIADQVVEKIRRDRVTAWVCAADHQGYQLIQDLKERGVRVPEDCSVTGYDGIEPPNGLPALTTVRVPNEDIGGAAVVRLLNRISRPHSVGTKILLNTQFVGGATTAKVTLAP